MANFRYLDRSETQSREYWQLIHDFVTLSVDQSYDWQEPAIVILINGYYHHPRYLQVTTKLLDALVVDISLPDIKLEEFKHIGNCDSLYPGFVITYEPVIIATTADPHEQGFDIPSSTNNGIKTILHFDPDAKPARPA
jgi:hypothetical protein